MLWSRHLWRSSCGERSSADNSSKYSLASAFSPSWLGPWNRKAKKRKDESKKIDSVCTRVRGDEGDPSIVRQKSETRAQNGETCGIQTAGNMRTRVPTVCADRHKTTGRSYKEKGKETVYNVMLRQKERPYKKTNETSYNIKAEYRHNEHSLLHIEKLRQPGTSHNMSICVHTTNFRD